MKFCRPRICWSLVEKLCWMLCTIGESNQFWSISDIILGNFIIHFWRVFNQILKKFDEIENFWKILGNYKNSSKKILGSWWNWINCMRTLKWNWGTIKRITEEVLWKFSENLENGSFRVSFIRIVRKFSKIVYYCRKIIIMENFSENFE